MKVLLSVLVASFAFAGAALAQSNDPQPRQTPREPQQAPQNPQQNPQQTPQQNPRQTAPRNPKTDPKSGRGGKGDDGMMAPADFATLDTRGAGYVTQQDVSSNAWMTRNFARCDADGNAQVSRAEFQRCAQGTGGSGQR